MEFRRRWRRASVSQPLACSHFVLTSVLPQPLAGRIAVVTGASRGIGEQIALLLARSGARVALAARDSSALKMVQAGICQEMGADAAIVTPTDVTSRESVRTCMAETEKKLGPVDILVNCAGVMVSLFVGNIPRACTCGYLQ